MTYTSRSVGSSEYTLARHTSCLIMYIMTRLSKSSVGSDMGTFFR